MPTKEYRAGNKYGRESPVRIPITNTNAKSLIIPAPKTQSETAASNVVTLVKIDLESTRLIADSNYFFQTCNRIHFEFFPNSVENDNRIINRVTHYH